MSRSRKIWIAVQVWWSFMVVSTGLWRHGLPDLTARLSSPASTVSYSVHPRRLGRIVHKLLRLGPYRPRCLVSSLVLYRLLRLQATDAELVIGLAADAKSPDAHAWVEVAGLDVGPPPGKGGHEELARYPSAMAVDGATSR